MSHLWEPMRHMYRPLAFYLSMEGAAYMGHVMLRAVGFQKREWLGMVYYVKGLSSQDRYVAPLLHHAPGGSGSFQK